MTNESTRPKRGLSLYMSILSAIVIELLTLLEFPHTALFFAAWTVVFAGLTVWETTRETKRSKKPAENRNESLLPNGQKPLAIIDLDQVGERHIETTIPEVTSAKGVHLENRLSHLFTLEESLLVIAFGVLALLNLILMVSVGAFGLVL